MDIMDLLIVIACGLVILAGYLYTKPSAKAEEVKPEVKPEEVIKPAPVEEFRPPEMPLEEPAKPKRKPRTRKNNAKNVNSRKS